MQVNVPLQQLGGGIMALDLKRGEELVLHHRDVVPNLSIAGVPAQADACSSFGLPR